MWASLRGGFAYLRSEPQMLVLVWMTVVVSFLGIPVHYLHPLLREGSTERRRKRPWLAAGLLRDGIGAGRDDRRSLRRVSPSRRVVTICGVVFFAAIIGFCYSHVFALSECLAFFEGFSGILMISCFNVSIQHLSSDEMRGRMMSIYATSFLGLPPLGALLAGELSRHIPTGHALAMMAGWRWCRSWDSSPFRGRCGNWIRQRATNESGNRLGAMRAAFRGGRNVAEALRACFGRWRHIRYRLLEAGHEGIGRNHDEEVNRRGNHQECDDGIQEIADHDVVDGIALKSGLPTRLPMNGREHILDERCDYRPNAPPMMTPTARSRTLPRRIKSRNPFSMSSSRKSCAHGNRWALQLESETSSRGCSMRVCLSYTATSKKM